MNKLTFSLFLAISAVLNSTAQEKMQLSGTITDNKTGQPLVAARVYLPDLRKGIFTDLDGKYNINHLPESTITIEISLLGYKTILREVNLTSHSILNVALDEAITELDELVVSGSSKAEVRSRTPTPISIISSIQLQQTPASNIIDALASEPGISQITTGSGISKPVIRGLAYNRVIVVANGVRQEGQQWGEEHGIEVDEYGINRVEILKGPASLAYGSDAMGGVIHLLAPPSLPEGTIKSSLLSNYQTNQGLLGNSLAFAGNKNGVVWDMRLSNKLAHTYKNQNDGYVFNSGYRENSQSALMGINKAWGYSHLLVSRYESIPGLINGERDKISGNFVKSFISPDGLVQSQPTTNSDFKSYKSFTPYQRIQHYKAVQDNYFFVGKGVLETTLGLQHNQRKEFEESLDDYGLYLLLNTLTYEINYTSSVIKRGDLTFGLSGMAQKSKNLGAEFLIPNYNLFDIGGFVLAKKAWERVTFAAGIRADRRAEAGEELYNEGDLRFSAFSRNFSGFSGSMGSTYKINAITFAKLNLSKGYRAPNIAELSANGVHEGSVNYILGNARLQPENSLQLDGAIGVNSNHLHVEVDGFFNRINHYIFLEKLKTPQGNDQLTEGYSTYQYTSGNARLFGGEIMVDLHPHPLDWLHIENSFSWVNALQLVQPDSMKYLPFTPAPKLQSEVKTQFKKVGKRLKNIFFKVAVEQHFAQNHFYAAFDTETATPGYTLLHLGAGTDVTFLAKERFSLFINVTNLTDKAYQSHLSRLKYLPINETTGRQGVFNMGRNISLKIVFPIYWQ